MWPGSADSTSPLPDGSSGCSASRRLIFYGRTSVYLSGSILEIEHFRRIRSYDDGELCLELGKGLLTIYGSQLKITALSTQRITLRGEILRTEFSRDATSR